MNIDYNQYKKEVYFELVATIWIRDMDDGIWQTCKSYSIQHIRYLNFWRYVVHEEKTGSESLMRKQARNVAMNLYVENERKVDVKITDKNEQCIWYDGNWIEPHTVIINKYNTFLRE